MGYTLSNKEWNKGFTLLELLVVIAIIGILSAITIAFVSVSNEKAKVARAQAEMKQIVGAIIIAQGNTQKPLISFAPSSNCVHCACADVTSAGCATAWETALTQIQTATRGMYPDLATKFKRDPWGNPWSMDANQGQSGAGTCDLQDSFGVFGGHVIPNAPLIPLSPVCP